jgi:hypothetical protein
MATGCRSPVLWRRAAGTGKRRARRSVQWLWPLIVPVGRGIAVPRGESWDDPQVVSPSSLPVQVQPTYPEPACRRLAFPKEGRHNGLASDQREPERKERRERRDLLGCERKDLRPRRRTISSTLGLTTAPTSSACL